MERWWRGLAAWAATEPTEPSEFGFVRQRRNLYTSKLPAAFLRPDSRLRILTLGIVGARLGQNGVSQISLFILDGFK